MSILPLLGGAFDFIFSIWPLLFLASFERRRRNVLGDMMLIWIFIFLGWSLARFESLPPFKLITPEPLNTFLFFLTGAVLFGLVLIRKTLEKRFIHRTASAARKPQDLLNITPAEFEKMVMELYNLHGYKAERTGAIGDHGVDITVQTPKGERWIVQCKRWRGGVGEPVVRDFFGTLHHAKADRGILVTTGTFSNAAPP